LSRSRRTELTALSLGLLFLAVGCAGLPKSSHPALLAEQVPVEPEAAWPAALAAVEQLGGKLVAVDEESRFCMFLLRSGFSRPRVWVNLYVPKDSAGEDAVYCFAHNRKGRSLREVDSDFFAVLRRFLEEGLDKETATPSWIRRRAIDADSPLLSPGWIEEGGSASFPDRSFDEVWHSLLLVCLQEGPVVHADKDSGVLAVGGRASFSLHLADKRPVSLFARRRKEPDSWNGASSAHWETVLFYRVERQLDSEGRWNDLVGG